MPSPGVTGLAFGNTAALVVVVAQYGAPSPQGIKLLAYAQECSSRPGVGGELGKGKVLVG